MGLKVFKKLFFTTSGVFFITLTLVFVLLATAINNEFAQIKYEALYNASDNVAEHLSAEDGDVGIIVRSISRVNNLDIYIADKNGRIFLCGCEIFAGNRNCTHTTTILSDNFLNNISHNIKSELSSVDGLYERMNYTCTKRVETLSGNTYYVISVSNVLTANDIIKMMFGIYALSAIVPLIFMFVAEYNIMYRLTRPLKYMSISAKAIANGDFSKRVPVMSNDEIGELSVLFNRMTDSLSKTEIAGKSFIANISHELKTPMTTISGFIDGILDGTIDDSRKEHYLKIVSDEVNRLSRLVQSMLSLVKLESGDSPINPVNFRLSDIITNIVISMEKKICDKNINIIGLDNLTQTFITCDMDLLYQVLYNLTDNAVKFTPNDGSIEFNLHRIEDNIEFKIKNTGEGIPYKDIPHIFERFYKSDESRSAHKDSLGLGLYLCKTVVELHGGEITVDSSPGNYTEFTVLLPINTHEWR